MDRSTGSTRNLLRRLISRSVKNEEGRRVRARLEKIFERHGVERKEGVDVLLEEVRRDGANTIASFFQQDLPPYIDIVQDVAKKIGVEEPKNKLNQLEEQIVFSVMELFLKKEGKDAEQFLEQLIKESEDSGLSSHEDLKKILNDMQSAGVAARSLGAMVLLADGLGAKIVSKSVTRLVAANAATAAGVRAASFAIPLLNVALVGWTVWDLAGPAYRKTIPTVLEIALLRMEFPKNGRRRSIE